MTVRPAQEGRPGCLATYRHTPSSQAVLGGELVGRLQGIVVRLRAYYGTPRKLEDLLAEYGWEIVEQGGSK